MTEKTIEDYKRELAEMHKRARPVVAQPLPWVGDSDASGRGTVIFLITSGRGALPVSGAQVTVSKAGEQLAVLRTNESGQTTPFNLPAPKRELSESPSTSGEPVYSLYDVSITAEGFVTQFLKDMPVFDGVTSLQSVQLLTFTASNGNSIPDTVDEANPYRL